jgi:hypothetical protein
VGVSHEAQSIAIRLCPIVVTIVRIFLVRFFFLRSVTSDRRLVLLVLWFFFD